MVVYLASSNSRKVQELSFAARDSGLDIRALPGIDRIQPPDETGSTFEANAILKARFYSAFTGEKVIADDSGLAVDALDGAPGVLSARYAGSGASDEENNTLLLNEMDQQELRTAFFICVLAIARSGECLGTAHGQVHGTILRTPRGEHGFGYDPLFFYPPLNRSFAELTSGQKLRVSHRGEAMRVLLNSRLLDP